MSTSAAIPRALNPAPMAGPWSAADARRRRRLVPEPCPAAWLVYVSSPDGMRPVAAGPTAVDALAHARSVGIKAFHARPAAPADIDAAGLDDRAAGVLDGAPWWRERAVRE